MNKVLGFILRLLLILLILALLGAGGWALHHFLAWDWWEVGALGLGLVGFIILALAARHLYFRHREERFIRRMVEQDRPRISAEDEDLRLAELRDRWRRGVDLLRHSGLSRLGSGIYALPWFMVMGESGSGKTTAISHARLSGGGVRADAMPGIASTRNCDWWFFEKAVVLDTAGRYAVPMNEAADNREWEEFVRLLAAHRRREPLNGLVLTLSTGHLERGEAAAADYGRCLRQRINTLMRALGADFPVYVLVTKMDRVLGFTDLAGLMSEAECRQALGLLNRPGRRDRSDNMAFLETALDHVRRRLQDLTMLFTVQARRSTSRACVLPGEMERLYPAVRAFCRAVFAPNPYGDTPLLRGIFFTSGRQEGEARSHVMEGLETFKDCSWRLPGTGSALFLSDFFATLLPRERSLSAITDRWFTRLTFRRHVPYMVWLLFLLIACAYFTVSFRTRMDDLAMARRDIPTAASHVQNLSRRVVLLSEAADSITSLEDSARRHRWLTPGRGHVDTALSVLRDSYIIAMRPDLVQADTARITDAVRAMQPADARRLLITLCDYTTWVNHVLASARDGAAFPAVADNMDLLTAGFEEYVPESSSRLNTIFKAYARWETPGVRDAMIAQQQAAIDACLNALGTSLDWVNDWLESRPGLSPVRATDFWPHGPDDFGIAIAYTLEGGMRMTALLTAIGRASQDRRRFDQLARDYMQRQADALRAAWWKMADEFSRAAQANLQPESWLRLGVAMAGRDNPYFAFIKAMSEAFTAVSSCGTPTAQDSLPAAFAEMMDRQSRAGRPETLESTITREKEKLSARVNQQHADDLAARDEAVKIFAGYLAALDNLRQATDEDAEALAMVTKAYRGGETASKTEAAAAVAASTQLQGVMDADNRAHSEFWSLVKGPVAWYMVMAVSRSACALNSIWSDTVASVVRDPAGSGQWSTVMDEQSPVNLFIHGPCQPFVRATRDGWRPASWLGMRYPISQDLLAYLDQGIDPARRARDKYVVDITALPVNVNELAQKPHRVRLRLECADSTQILDNYNYEVSASFTWQPEVCGRVSLEFSFGSQTVTTTWDGQYAFQTFLRDFAGGEVLLTPEDFPGQEAVLEEMDVSGIRVRYALRGATDAIMAMFTTDLPLPAQAAWCPLQAGAGGSDTLSGLRLPQMPDMVQAQHGSSAAGAAPAAGVRGGKRQ